MSASNSIKTKTTSNHWLLISLFAIFGTSVQASDGLKPITPNTSSVTAGSSSGAASVTSSVGDSAKYDSGVDWSKASSIPWKGINWDTSGTIPQARIPPLATSQIPTLTQSQLPDAFPSKWASSISSPTGSLCGWSKQESYGNNNNKWRTIFNITCKGHNTSSSCPSGYTRFQPTNGSYERSFSCYAR